MSRDKTVSALIWSGLEQSSSKLVTVLVQIILARILSPESFGVLAILLVITNVGDALSQSGLGSALIQKEDANNRSYSTGFWLSLAIAAFVYGVVCLIAPFVAGLYNSLEMTEYLRVIALIIPFNSVNSIQRSYLQKSLNFKTLFRVNLFSAVLSGVAGITAALLGLGVWALIIQTIVQSLLVFVMMLFLLRWKPSLEFSFSEAQQLFSYGWKMCVANILGVIYNGISELVIGKACSPVALGYYSQGRKYPMAIITTLTNALQNVMFPTLSSYQSDEVRFKCVAKKMLALGTFVICPTAALFAAIARPIIVLLLTDKWLPCVMIFQAICLCHCPLMHTLTNLRSYMALGFSGLYLKLQLIKTFYSGTIICATAIITSDIYVTAAATCIVTFINSTLVDPLPAKRVYGYRLFDQHRDQLPTYLLTIIAFLVSSLISACSIPDIVMVGLQIVVFLSVYLGGAKALKLSSFEETVRIIGQVFDKKEKHES